MVQCALMFDLENWWRLLWCPYFHHELDGNSCSAQQQQRRQQHSLATSLLPNRTIPISRLTSSFAYTTQRHVLCILTTPAMWTCGCVCVLCSVRCLRYLIFVYSLMCFPCLSLSPHIVYHVPAMSALCWTRNEYLRMPAAAYMRLFRSFALDMCVCVRARAIFFILAQSCSHSAVWR